MATNFSRMPMPRVLDAATVVSEITERLSPNMAPPTTAPARTPGVNGGSPTNPAAMGIRAAMVPQLVPRASEIRHATTNTPASMKRAGMIVRAIVTAASTAPDALAAEAKAPARAACGIEGFAARAAECGINGVILPDVPFEEREEFAPVFRKYGIDLISMIAPTSHERIRTIASRAEGFVYVVSSLGVTGIRQNITTDLGAMVALVREANPEIPCAIGFGIATPEQAERMGKIADGVIVGSAIVKQIGALGTGAPEVIGAYTKEMKEAANR